MNVSYLLKIHLPGIVSSTVNLYIDVHDHSGLSPVS